MGTDEPENRSHPSERRVDASEDSSPSDGTTYRGGANSQRHKDLLLACLEVPTQNVDRLPFVLTLLESDDQERRFLAAMAACRIATATDDQAIVEYLIRRLSDRLTGNELSLELTTALDYLTASHTGDTETLLTAVDEDLESGMPVPAPGRFTRTYYLREIQREQGATHGVTSEETGDSKTDEQVDGNPQQEEAGLRTVADSPTISRESALTTGLPDPETLAEKSRFDQVNVEGEQYRGRYETVYETIASHRGTQRAVSLRVLDHPPATGDIHPFETSVGEALGEWAAVSDHRHILSVLDWGSSPRPWVATALTATTLADRSHSGFDDSLRTAISLTEAVSSLHQYDVVHGGIDPGSVVFPSEPLTDTDGRRVPLLDHVGLVGAYNEFVSFDTFLTPTFVAPEYYTDQFGRIDHLTDIYQLGATCYYLFTGRPPFNGERGPVRDAVLNDDPQPPSEVADGVPETLDNIISKTLAREKLRRYETTEQFLQDLRAVDELAESG